MKKDFNGIVPSKSQFEFGYLFPFKKKKIQFYLPLIFALFGLFFTILVITINLSDTIISYLRIRFSNSEYGDIEILGYLNYGIYFLILLSVGLHFYFKYKYFIKNKDAEKMEPTSLIH